MSIEQLKKEGKKYDSSWSDTTVEVVPTKREGHGMDREIREAGLNEARRQFFSACAKYGPEARNLARINIQESLLLFGSKGQYWIKGDEEVPDEEWNEELNETVELPSSFCAIGAIHKANGQAEHLARLAANLAAGELFPGRSGLESLNSHWDYEKDTTSYTVELPDVVAVNDDKKTRFADIKLVFKRAAELLK